MNRWELIHADVLAGLAQIADNSVHACITSPPYWNLRDYGYPEQIGLEPTVQEWVARLADVFDEVRRVLRPDGTAWVNLGDSYASEHGGGGGGFLGEIAPRTHTNPDRFRRGVPPGFKPKDLIGQPWRFAFAAQERGWWLRADVIWEKPNAMPEPPRDRPARSHEYLFQLTKSERYYYDADATREPHADARRGLQGMGDPSRLDTEARDARMYGNDFPGRDERAGRQVGDMPSGGLATGRAKTFRAMDQKKRKRVYNPLGRVRRSVWTVPTQGYPGAHFATFPEALVEPCVLASCPPGGLVLDPFAGSGRAGAVAVRLGRRFVGIEAKAEYVAMARDQIATAEVLS